MTLLDELKRLEAHLNREVPILRSGQSFDRYDGVWDKLSPLLPKIIAALEEAGQLKGRNVEAADALGRAMTIGLAQKDEIYALKKERDRLRAVAEAAELYLMRSVPDPNVGSNAEDRLREALAAWRSRT